MGQSASSYEAPEWTQGYFKELPNSYIEVVYAHGYDLKQARDRAAQEAIHRRSLASGTEASVVSNDNQVSVTSSHDLIVKSRIIDEYIIRSYEGYRVFMLVQTAKNPSYEFEPVCVTEEYPVSARVLVPGMAQIHKGQITRGSIFIGAECLFVAGIVGGELAAKDAYNKSLAFKHDANMRKAYLDRANMAKLVSYASMAGAAVTYIWNVIDGSISNGKKHVVVGNTAIRLTPYADNYTSGLALNVTF